MPYDPRTVFDHSRKLPKAMRGYASLFQRSSNAQVSHRFDADRPLYDRPKEVRPHPFASTVEPCTNPRESRFRPQRMRHDKPGKWRLNCKQHGYDPQEPVGLWRKTPDGRRYFDPT